MAELSFWDEQDWSHRQTRFCLALGAVWMALMGFMVVEAHAAFIGVLAQELGESQSAARASNPGLLWGFAGAGVSLLLWALVALFLYYRAAWVIPRLVGAHEAGPIDARRLRNTVEEMAIAAQVDAPIRWHVLETPIPNAFACGRSPATGSIVVTRGLLDVLDGDELQAVLAHEIAHLENGDTAFVVQALAFVWMLIGVCLAVGYGLVAVGILLTLGIVAIGAVLEVLDDDVAGIIALLAIVGGVLLLVVAAFVYLTLYLLLVGTALALVAVGVKTTASAISQAREYLADACAAQWTRNPPALASALEKISGAGRLPREALVSPLLLHSASSGSEDRIHAKLLLYLLRTHPDIGRRIAVLRAMGPGTGPKAVPPPSRFRERAPLVLATLLAAGIVVMIGAASVPGTDAARATAAVQPRPTVYVGTVNRPVVRVRAGPSTSHQILARVRQGDQVLVAGRRGDWYRVEWGPVSARRPGWIRGDLLDVQAR